MNTSMLSRIIPLLAALSAVGCTASETGFVPIIAPDCVQTQTNVGLDDTIDTGFTASEALARLSQTHTATFKWMNGSGTTELTVAITHSGDTARLVKRFNNPAQPVPDYEYTEQWLEACAAQWLELDANVHFATADGSFEESWTETVYVDKLDHIGMRHDIPMNQLAGSYDDPNTDYVQIFNEITSQGDGEGAAQTWLSGSMKLAGDVQGQDGLIKIGDEPAATW